MSYKNRCENFKRKLKEEFPDYELLSNYTKMNEKITLRHNCGYKFTIRADSLFIEKNDPVCPICKKKRRRLNA